MNDNPETPQSEQSPIDRFHDRVNALDSRTPVGFDEECKQLRELLRPIGSRILALKLQASGHIDSGEMIANVQLAYRHMEDAIMRLGKAIQAFDGGKSVYPR